MKKVSILAILPEVFTPAIRLIIFLINTWLFQGGGQEKIPGTYDGVGGWSNCLFWDFFRLILGFFPLVFAQFLLFFDIFASKFGSSRKNGSILDVETMFRSDILRNVG